jgi:predicted transcriptional regulator
MNKECIDASTIERCATALKEIHDNTKHGFNKLSVHIVFNAHQVPYYTLLPRIMQEKAIITRGKKGIWSWVTTTEPNLTMAEALLNACKLAGKRYNKEHNAKQSTDQVVYTLQPIQKPITPLISMQNQINLMKAGLMSLGWSEDDALTMIRQQIK